ncbi:uncharacterized protein LOC129726052 isoform X2 [Wyeomyia smithii]|uniref:uncharacterized protein LOC129726052 isoform X2 n=1 Tax=Wyeomyia smithii TaxID=174621 RepID=UPI002468022E|nr:uncharacterized protein LOC129726052 isoform X2 [Wyeomyia smithii]
MKRACMKQLPLERLGFGFLLIFLVAAKVDGLPRIFRSNEICGVYNGHRVYLELGDRGQLQASNVTVLQQTNKTIPTICTLELVTCPSCNLKISLSYSNFPTKCAIRNESPCRCDYLEFSEPPFELDQSGRRNCGNDVIYQSQTRSALIRFIHWNNHSHAFTLEYVAERNRESLQGIPGQVHNLTGAQSKIITTPFFPSYYPRDFGKEYVLSCAIENCRINVIFSDFQLAKTSTMEFYDWNGQRLSAISGVSFRPPVVQSSGPSMIVRFFANGGSGLGYRAKVSFLTVENAANPAMMPDTNCGGMVENIGGAITMMNMVSNENDSRIFDCIWLLKPPNTYAHLKTHLSLKINTLEKMGARSLLTVIQGTTSNSPIMDVVRTGSSAEGRNYVVPLTSGFYIHLRGTFGQMSRIALVYAAFSYLDCYMGSEFLCQNRKCIPVQLHCDGFDHCGDGSDEPESCEAQWETETIDRRWYSHTPNYYFPKIERYPDLRTATTIFIASSLGLISLISALVILLYRSGNRARQQRELQSHLQTISELLADNNNTRGSEEVDEPPMYEAPPDYDEIIKVGMEDDIKRKRRRSSSSASGRRSRMRRSRRSSVVSDSHNPILEVCLPPETGADPSSSGSMLQVPRGSELCQMSDQDEDDLQEQDVFMSTRILEASASGSQIQAFGEAGPSTGFAPFGSSSNDPPLYDGSQRSRNDAILRSGSNSDSISRGFTEEAPVITLSLNDCPQKTTDSGSLPPDNTSSSNCNRPQHIWSESSRSYRPWLAFNNEDLQTPNSTSSSNTAMPLDHPNRYRAFDAEDLGQFQEISAYQLAFGSVHNQELRSSGNSCNNLESCSSGISFSQLPPAVPCQKGTTACNSLNGLDYISRNCPCCRDSFNVHNSSQCRNQPTVPPVICSTCGGKISLQESSTSCAGDSTVQPTSENDNNAPNPAVRLCNCFPKFSSKNRIIRMGLANAMAPRPLSVDQIEDGSRRSVATLTSDFEAFFNSHIGIPNCVRKQQL